MLQRNHGDRRVSPEHGLWMLTKGNHHRVPILGGGPVPQLIQEHPVATMHSIKEAYRRYPAPSSRGVSKSRLYIFVELHLRSRIPGRLSRTLSDLRFTLGIFLLELPQCLFSQQLLRGVEVPQKKNPVQMVQLMLKDPGIELEELLCEHLSGEILVFSQD
jgi:hypothetical protein